MRKSITSASMPSCSQLFCCFRGFAHHYGKGGDGYIIARANHLCLADSATQSSCSGTSKLWPYITSFSRKITGFGSRIAAFNKPLASADQGETTFKPGQCAYQLALIVNAGSHSAGSPVRPAKHNRTAHLPTRHVECLCCGIDNLINCLH